jgi:sterol desaturase/sphingolipid hydroxylase (fatty acid hydroxylase superfamily)
VFGVVALIDLLYQYWVHTQQIGKLGWFDRWFCSASNHRVHHAVNEKYLDKNYGGILIVWDRMFGSFVEEDAPSRASTARSSRCAAGTRSGPM